MLTLKTIDAHTGGGPLRLVTSGFPSPRGRTMIEKREWARQHADRIRRSLMLEPRGHADMCGAVLTEPVAPGSHAGILFMDNHDYGDVLGHAVIAATTIAIERGLLLPGGDGASVVFDTTAGPIRVRAERAGEAVGAGRAGESGEMAEIGEGEEGSSALKVRNVKVLLPPSFVLHGGLTVRIGSRQVRADIAFGGAFHAIVDAEAAGLPLDAAHGPEIRRAGMEIRHAIEGVLMVSHPTQPELAGIHATMFTGPAHQAGADLRTVAIFADAAVDRSPSPTGMAAILAVLDAMGLVGTDAPFVCEGLPGTRLVARIAGRSSVGDYAVVPEIEGSGWIVGEHTFFVHDTDPLAFGFRA